jgi:molybdopterin molybdotransferase
MISVNQAIELISTHCRAAAPAELPIGDCGGLTLAKDMYSAEDFPAFAQSSMDGYAFRFSDYASTGSLFVQGEVQAGSNEQQLLLQDQAMRIFTGAPLPDGADTVVMQEKAELLNGKLIVHDESLRPGLNTRPTGADIKQGTLAMRSGASLSAAAIGFLAGLGNDRLTVFPKPRITIIVTGKELQSPGKPRNFGQVYESNSFALRAVLDRLYITDVQVQWADDDLEILQKVLANALEQSDLVLLAGGISVGAYDFVLEATKKNGVTQLFHKLKQRPGKPLFFGMKENIPVFGLPGNPSSVLTCFYEYVIPCLGIMMQKKNILRKSVYPLAKDYQKNAGLTHFLKGYCDGETAMPLEGQESYRMSSYAQANCLIVLPEEKEFFRKDEEVQVHWTDYFAIS